MNPVSIRDVDNLVIWGETDAIRSPKSIRHNPNSSSFGTPPVYLIGQARRRPISLLRAVNGICKPDRAIRVHDHVIDRIKRPAKEVLFQQFRLIRSGGGHAVQPAWFSHGTLCAEEDVVFAIVNSSVAHGNLCGYFLAGDWVSTQINTSDVYFLLSIRVNASVAGDEEVVCKGVVDPGLVGEGIVIVFC